ncbi:MAG: protein kinase [Planctomycetes bacterium]|nr:protein kinase [Planctomycetota bacterium]
MMNKPEYAPESNKDAKAIAALPDSVTDAERATLPLPAPTSGVTPDAERATLPLLGAMPSTIPTNQPLPGKIGRFDIRGWLGAGAFGDVYRAYDPQLDREIALKVAKPGTLDTPERISRFLREAKAAANLRHPNIVPLYETGRDGERLFLATAFIPGQTLEVVVQDANEKGAPIALDVASRIIRKLAEALAYAHSQGVVHRDVKPANVILDAQGEPLLLDFGLASRVEAGDERLTTDGQGMGTPAYMAPEQVDGTGTSASDQYSLGCALFELVTGQTPFSGGPAQQMFLHKTQTVQSPRSLRRDVPRDLERVILKSLEKEPTRRYADCGEFAQDLRRFIDREPISIRPPGLFERGTKWVKRHRTRLAVSAVLLLAIGVTLGAVHRRLANQEVNERLSVVSSALIAPDWEPAKIDGLEDHLAVLDHLSPQVAADARQRIVARLEDYIDAILNRATQLTTEDLARVDASIARMRNFDTERATAARSRRVRRFADWRTDTHLAPPFSGFEQVCLPDRGFSVEGDVLRWKPSSVGQVGGRLSVPSDGPIRITAEFVDLPKPGESIGFMLNVPAPNQGATALACSSTDPLLAIGRRDGSIALYDTGRSAETKRISGPTNSVIGLNFTADGKHLLGAWSDGTLQLRAVSDGRVLFKEKLRDEVVTATAVGSDGGLIGVGTNKGEILIWDRSTGGRKSYRGEHMVGRPIAGVAFSPDGSRIYAGWNTVACCWDRLTGRPVWQDMEHAHTITATDLSHDGKVFATLTPQQRYLRLFDSATGRQLSGYVLKAGTPTTFNLSVQTLFLAEQTGTILGFDGLATKHQVTISGGPGTVRRLACGYDVDRVYALYASGGVTEWNTLTSQGLPILKTGSYRIILSNALQAQVSAQSVSSQGLELQVLRDETVLRRQAIPTPTGRSIRFTICRDEAAITAELNGSSTVRFIDLEPIPPEGGSIAVFAPGGCGLMSLRIDRRDNAPNPTPLDQGNLLFAAGRYAEVVEAFRPLLLQTPMTPPSRRVWREAACKTGIALIRLGRPAEAVAALRGVIDQPSVESDEWTVKSGFLLAEVFDALGQTGHATAAIEFALVTADADVRALDVVTSRELTSAARRQYSRTFNLNSLLLPNITSLREIDTLMRLWAREGRPGLSATCWISRLEIARLAGSKTVALDSARALQKAYPDWTQQGNYLSGRYRWGASWEDYFFIAREYGVPRDSLKSLDGYLYLSGKQEFAKLAPESIAWLLVERSRLQISLGDLAGARQSLDALFQHAATFPNFENGYQAYATGKFISGCLRDQAGETVAAVEDWKKGLYTDWLNLFPIDVRKTITKKGDRFQWRIEPILHALTRAPLDDADQDINDCFFVERLTADMPKLAEFMKLASLYPRLTSLPWNTLRGREIARRIAFRQLGQLETYRLVLVFGAYHAIRSGLGSRALTTEEDEFVYQTVRQAFEAYSAGTIPPAAVMPLAGTWGEGDLSEFGWKGSSRSLPPDLRGAFGLILSLRISDHFRRPEAATQLLKQLVDDPAATAECRRLATSTMNRLAENSRLPIAPMPRVK